MSDLLKGNYKIPGLESSGPTADSSESTTNEFERRALERLGGSIAYVKKGTTFVWSGDTKNGTKE